MNCIKILLRLYQKALAKEIKHFNIFKTDELAAKLKIKPMMPYNRRTYYKISINNGSNKAEYADKIINIKKMLYYLQLLRYPTIGCRRMMNRQVIFAFLQMTF